MKLKLLIAVLLTALIGLPVWYAHKEVQHAYAQIESMRAIFNNIWDRTNGRLMVTPWAGAQGAFETEQAILNNVWDSVGNRLRTSGTGASLSSTTAGYLVWNNIGTDATEGIPTNTQTLAGSAGTLNQLYCKVSTAPGTGKSYAFQLRKNAVNTASTCTISDTNTSCNDTSHSTAVVQDDLLSIKVTPSGTPASTAGTCSISGPSIASITTGTTTNITGLLYGNGATIQAAALNAGDGIKITDSSGTFTASTTGYVTNITFCGDDGGANNTNYMGPATPMWTGDVGAYVLASGTCSALDNATEATADAPVSTLALAVKGMRCITDQTLGASESIVYTLRSAAADVTPSVTCTIGTGATECRSNVATNIAAGATMAVKQVLTSDNAVGHGWCQITVSLP